MSEEVESEIIDRENRNKNKMKHHLRTGAFYRSRCLQIPTRSVNRLRNACLKNDIDQIFKLLIYDGIANNDNGFMTRGMISIIPRNIQEIIYDLVYKIAEDHRKFTSLVLPAVKKGRLPRSITTTSIGLEVSHNNNPLQLLNGHGNRILILVADFISLRSYALRNSNQLLRLLRVNQFEYTNDSSSSGSTEIEGVSGMKKDDVDRPTDENSKKSSPRSTRAASITSQSAPIAISTDFARYGRRFSMPQLSKPMPSNSETDS